MERGWEAEAAGGGDTLPRDIPAASHDPKAGTCSQDDAATHTQIPFPTESGLPVPWSVSCGQISDASGF